LFFFFTFLPHTLPLFYSMTPLPPPYDTLKPYAVFHPFTCFCRFLNREVLVYTVTFYGQFSSFTRPTLRKIARTFRENFVFFPKCSHFFLKMGELFAHFEEKMGKIRDFPENLPWFSPVYCMVFCVPECVHKWMVKHPIFCCLICDVIYNYYKSNYFVIKFMYSFIQKLHREG